MGAPRNTRFIPTTDEGIVRPGRRRLRLVLAAALLGAMPFTAPWAGFAPVDAPGSGDETASEAQPARSPDMDMDMPKAPPRIESLMRQMMVTGEDIADRPGNEPVPMDTTASGQPAFLQGLKVTKADNPMLSQSCQRKAMSFSVERLAQAMGLEDDAAALQAAAEHIQGHLDDLAGGPDGRIDYATYLREVANCRAFCGPLVAQLMECHVLSVARHEHGIVLFPINRHQVDGRYLDDGGLISEVGQSLAARPDKRALLVGRASRIGDLRYNRRLAGLRTLEVKDQLMARGVAEDRIHALWFGWEPPQIDGDVAREYGFEELYQEQGDHAVNQSVVVVLFEQGHDHGDHSHSSSEAEHTSGLGPEAPGARRSGDRS